MGTRAPTGRRQKGERGRRTDANDANDADDAAGNQVRTGMALDIEGKIYRVGKTQHVKPGKGGAYVQVRAHLMAVRDGDRSGYT